ncbi:MAG TPA: YigZ family protein [Bacilli bacterium]
MLDSYKTVQDYGEKQIIIKKSRFIGQAKPVENEQEALSFIEEIRKRHWSATHNCFAYVAGDRDQFQKQSDDGEPQGTAGKPILEIIKQKELKNVAIVVTRYFGGVMLGAGGLIRAYADGAQAALEAARIVTKTLHCKVKIEIDYPWLGKLENELRHRGILMGQTEFTDRVALTCLPLAAESASFAAWVTDLTQGQCVITHGEPEYVMHPA